MTHKITLPDGTIIEIFTNADEVGQTDLDIQALWREAEQKAQRKMKILNTSQYSVRKKAAHTKNRQDGNNARGKYGKASRNHRIFIK